MEKASREDKDSGTIASPPEKRQLESPPTSTKRNLLHKPIVHIFLIIIMGFLAYSNTFRVPFQFDDMPNIVGNYELRDLKNFWPPSESRWVGFLTLAINYQLGGLNTFGYHIFNLLIHILNAILVYWLLTLTFKTPYFKVSVISASVSNQPNQFNRSTFKPLNYLPLFIALLFVSHPIQTQAVTYIAQRFASLATFFYLLSLAMYIKFRMHDTRYTIQDKKSKNRESCIMHHASEPKLHATRYTLYAVSLISAILAIKTKEIAFTLPVIITLYEFIFFATARREGNIKRRILYLIPLLLTMLIIPLSLIGIDKPIGEIIGDVSEATRAQTAMPRLDYLFTEFSVIVTYIRLLFFPVNQNLDYDYPVYHSFFEPEVFLSFLFLLSIFSLGIYLFYRSRFAVHNSQFSDSRLPALDFRLISFGIFWFFITLSIESSIIPIEDVIFEHRVYLPSVGAFIAITVSIFSSAYKLKKWSIKRIILLPALILIILTGVTYARNIVWQDRISLWEDVIKKSPKKARGYFALAHVYERKGQFEESIAMYEKVISLAPNFTEAYFRLGVIYSSTGQLDTALEAFKKALSAGADQEDTHNEIGIIYARKGDYEAAMEEIARAIRINPNYADAYFNRGVVYVRTGMLDNAISDFQKACAMGNKNGCEALKYVLDKRK